MLSMCEYGEVNHKALDWAYSVPALQWATGYRVCKNACARLVLR